MAQARLNINMSEKMQNDLNEIISLTDDLNDKTSAVKAALSQAAYLQKRRSEGKVITVSDPDGSNAETIVFL